MLSQLFHEGEIVRGKVIDQIDPQHAILRFRGHSLLVETRIPLDKGSEGSFRVEASSPKVILKVLPDVLADDLPVNWLKKYLSHDCSIEDLMEGLSGLGRVRVEGFPERVREVFQDFMKLLDAFSLKELSRNPVHLQEMVTRSGLFLENRLKQMLEGELRGGSALLLKDDLKALVLKLNSQLNLVSDSAGFSREDRSVVENLVKGLDQFIQKLELYQILNLTQSDPHGKIFLLLPIWFQNELQFAEMEFSSSHQGSKDSQDPAEETLSILFFLHLPKLGRMSIDVKMKERNIYCLFATSDPEVSKLIDQGIPDLNIRLSRLGFQSHVSVSTETTTPIGPSPINEMGEDLKSLLSIIV